MTYIIQPFRQRIIWPDLLWGGDGRSCLDVLNDDLSFHSTEFEHRGTPQETLIEALALNIARPEGWVLLESELTDFTQLWPIAVKKLGKGHSYSPLTGQTA